MSGPTRQMRRRLKVLTLKNELTIKADAKFFERWPARSFRMRLASAAEIEMDALSRDSGSRSSPGWRLYIIVHNIAPGIRMRAHIVGREAVLHDGDLPEEEIADFWAQASSRPGSRMAEIQRRFEDAARARDGQ